MKAIFRIVLIVLIVCAGILVGRNMIVQAAVGTAVKAVTGLGLSMQKLNIGIANSLIDIQGLKILNPEGFQERTMLDMPKIYVDYELGALLKNKIHLESLKIHMNEFIVVKNQKGELNLDSLRVVQQQKTAESGKPAEPAKKGKAPEMLIDQLDLKIGKVIFKDYSKGGEPDVKEFNVNINEQYQNITNPNKLVALLVMKALMGTPIAMFTNFDLAGLNNLASDTLNQAQQKATEAVGKAKEMALTAVNEKVKLDEAKKVATQTVGKAEETVKDAASALTGQLSGLTEKVKLPSFGFGGSKESTSTADTSTTANQ